MEECADPLQLAVDITFGTASDADSDLPEVFSLPDPRAPKNVGLEIADADRKTIRPGVPVSFNAVETGKSFPFNVRFRETKDTVRGGVVSRPVTVLVNFR
jgi:type 1 fimbria pilin